MPQGIDFQHKTLTGTYYTAAIRLQLTRYIHYIVGCSVHSLSEPLLRRVCQKSVKRYRSTKRNKNTISIQYTGCSVERLTLLLDEIV